MIKNIVLYSILDAKSLSASNLAELLAENPKEDCGDLDLQTSGWISPLPEDMGDALTYVVGGVTMIRLGVQTKAVNSKALKQEVNKRVKEKEVEQARKLNKGEKQDIRDAVHQEMLKKAPVVDSYIDAFIDLENSWLLAAVSSEKKAEFLLTELRKTLGTLPVTNVRLNHSVERVMTEWLADAGEVPDSIVLGEKVDLVGEANDTSKAKLTSQPLDTQEVRTHLERGKRVAKLQFEWDEKVSLNLSDKFVLFNIKLTGVEPEELGDVATDFDSEATLHVGSVRALLKGLVGVFGGEHQEAYAAANAS